MSKNQFTGTATQLQRNRNATANVVNLIMNSTGYNLCFKLKRVGPCIEFLPIYIFELLPFLDHIIINGFARGRL